jgi:hypothetical protein
MSRLSLPLSRPIPCSLPFGQQPLFVFAPSPHSLSSERVLLGFLYSSDSRHHLRCYGYQYIDNSSLIRFPSTSAHWPPISSLDPVIVLYGVPVLLLICKPPSRTFVSSVFNVIIARRFVVRKEYIRTHVSPLRLVPSSWHAFAIKARMRQPLPYIRCTGQDL